MPADRNHSWFRRMVEGNAMTSDAQKRANAKQDATRKRVAIWLPPEKAKKVDRAVKRLGLSSREAFIDLALEKLAP